MASALSVCHFFMGSWYRNNSHISGVGPGYILDSSVSSEQNEYIHEWGYDLYIISMRCTIYNFLKFVFFLYFLRFFLFENNYDAFVPSKIEVYRSFLNLFRRISWDDLMQNQMDMVVTNRNEMIVDRRKVSMVLRSKESVLLVIMFTSIRMVQQPPKVIASTLFRIVIVRIVEKKRVKELIIWVFGIAQNVKVTCAHIQSEWSFHL